MRVVQNEYKSVAARVRSDLPFSFMSSPMSDYELCLTLFTEIVCTQSSGSGQADKHCAQWEWCVV